MLRVNEPLRLLRSLPVVEQNVENLLKIWRRKHRGSLFLDCFHPERRQRGDSDTHDWINLASSPFSYFLWRVWRAEPLCSCSPSLWRLYNHRPACPLSGQSVYPINYFLHRTWVKTGSHVSLTPRFCGSIYLHSSSSLHLSAPTAGQTSGLQLPAGVRRNLWLETSRRSSWTQKRFVMKPTGTLPAVASRQQRQPERTNCDWSNKKYNTCLLFEMFGLADCSWTPHKDKPQTVWTKWQNEAKD